MKNELSEEMLEDLLQKNMVDLEFDKRERHAVMATNMRQFLLSGSSNQQNMVKDRKKTMQRYVLLYLAQKPEIYIRYSKSQISPYIDCFDLENLIQENGIRCRAFLEVSNNEYCCVLYIDANVSNVNDRCYEIAMRVLQRMEDEDYHYVAFISNPVTNFLALPEKYERLNKQVSRVFAKKEKVYFEEKEKDKIMASGDLSSLLNRWSVTIENLEVDAANQALQDYLQEICNRCDIWGYIERIQSLYYFFSNKMKEKELSNHYIEIKDSYYDIQKLEFDILQSQRLCLQELQRRSERNYSRHVILAQKYILEHYSQDISVADIAEAAGISEGHLRRCFKKELNESVINYLVNHRIAIAKKLMKQSSGSIDEICKQTGFTSGQYFSYVFKKKEGISPSEYIREIGSGSRE